MQKWVIITAGGKGTRMGTDIPKQFLLINNRPVLFYTIEQFCTYDPNIGIILVLPHNQIDYWKTLIEEFQFTIPHKIVTGGETRYHSIKNGLETIDQGMVAIHDGVRPFVSNDVITEAFGQIRSGVGIVPVLKVKESVRKLNGDSSASVNRDDYVLVQTPQCFNVNEIKAAYELEYSTAFTDDASVFEAAGNKIQLVEGNEENIKITTPRDLKMAKLILSDS